MKAKVIKPFKGVKDGEIQPTDFVADDTVEGDLARVAVEEKWAKRIAERKPEPEPKAEVEPEAEAEARKEG